MSSGAVIEVKEDGVLLAIIVHRWDESPGIRFFTGPECPLQLGWMRREEGHVVAPHRHSEVCRRVVGTAEVLVVQRGVVQLDVYGKGEGVYRQFTLRAGDTVLFLSGGHGLTVLEEAIILEVKQGPYLSDDKLPI